MTEQDQERQLPSEIRGVLIPLQGEQLLLPNAAVAEVIDYREPSPQAGAPDWLLGSTSWRQRNLPIIRLERLLGQEQAGTSARQRIVVCHTLSDEARRPFVGIVATAIPRLVRVREEQLQTRPVPAGEGQGVVQARLALNDEAALVPDLAALERLISQAS
jgi:chemosensory pili system protein ChpC